MVIAVASADTMLETFEYLVQAPTAVSAAISPYSSTDDCMSGAT